MTSLENLASRITYVYLEETRTNIKRKVRLYAIKPEARLRLLMLHISYFALHEKQRWKCIYKLQKNAVKHPVAELQLPLLKTHFKDALQLGKHNLKADFVKFNEFWCYITKELSTINLFLNSFAAIIVRKEKLLRREVNKTQALKCLIVILAVQRSFKERKKLKEKPLKRLKVKCTECLPVKVKKSFLTEKNTFWPNIILRK